MNPVLAIVIQPDNTIKETTLTTFQDYKKALNYAYLEAVGLQNGVMYVDEEFLLKNPTMQDANRIATRLVRSIGRIQPDTLIFGPAIVVGLPDGEGDDTDIHPDVHTLIKQIQMALRVKEN